VTDQLDWTHKVVDIPAGGLRRERETTESERKAVASALGLLGLHSLAARYRIEAIAGDAYRLSGTVSGEVDQACVVTLEPVSSKVEASFDVEFWPELEPADRDEDATVLEGPDVERFEHGIIPVGRIIFETLSASLDPYPRRDDAEFRWQDPRAEEPEKTGPFAALSKLKDKG
jgi:uncharacterized metal-binding protein YceD (DUF177 family)